MMTLVTGRKKLNKPITLGSLEATQQEGFTLIEILVVVALVAIMASAVTLSIPVSEMDEVEKEARKFSVRVQMATDQAIVESTAYGLEFEDEGYRFFKIVKAKPTEDNDDSMFEEKSPEWQEVDEAPLSSVVLEQSVLDCHLQGSPFSQVGQAPSNTPSILISSTGELSPFDCTFSRENVGDVSISFDALANATTTLNPNTDNH